MKNILEQEQQELYNLMPDLVMETIYPKRPGIKWSGTYNGHLHKGYIPIHNYEEIFGMIIVIRKIREVIDKFPKVK